MKAALDGRKAPNLPHFQCETGIRTFQTFHVWLRSLGGVAARYPSFDTATEPVACIRSRIRVEK
jgi:hypothetical protein